MDAPVSVQRPRPQNLSLAMGGNINDLKVVTASLKQRATDWTIALKSSTSATFKRDFFEDKDQKSASLIGTY